MAIVLAVQSSASALPIVSAVPITAIKVVIEINHLVAPIAL